MWIIAVLICLGWIVSLCLHEFGHAITAYWGGDKSVKEKGYLTLNPLKYTDPGVSLLMPLLILMIGGIALPGGAVYIDHQSLRDRKWESAVSVAGPFADMVIAVVLSIPFIFGWHNAILDGSGGDSWWMYIYPAIAYVINLNIFVVLINLLPIPGLDGFGIIAPWLPRQIKPRINWLYRYGIWILMGLLWFVPPLSRGLWEITFMLGNVLQVPRELIFVGSEGFRQYSVFLVLGLIGFLWIFRDKNKDQYRRGSQLVSQGKYDQALIKFDALVQRQPDNPDALFMQGYTLYCLGRYDDALTAYARALEFQPNSAQIYYYQGILYQEVADAAAAIASFTRAIQENPEDTKSWQKIAELQFAQQANTEALTAINQALELEPNQAAAWELKADILKNLHQTTEAIAAYHQAFNLNPNSTAWIKLVKLYEQIHTPAQDQTENLLAIYTRKLRLQPHNPEIWYRQGISYNKLQRPQEAATSYQQGLAYLTHQTKRHPRNPQAWLEQAKYLEKIHRHPEAETAYQQAATLLERKLQRQQQQSTAEDWYEYGLILEKIQQPTPAITAYTQAIALDPKLEQAAYQITLIHIHNQAYHQALTSCDQVLENRPTDSSMWWLRGDILIKLEKYEQAIAACDRAIKLFPEFYGFWLSRGTALYYLHQYTDAHAAYDTATQTQPESAKAWNYKALALIKLAQSATDLPVSPVFDNTKLLNDAMIALEKAIKINPNYGDAWYNQACILALQNNHYSAIIALTQAIKIEPEQYRYLAQQDQDLINLHQHPDFNKLMK
ncbi:tetratricopeptide repeat protein [Calothrix sp. NIES-3974]|uniref:tetratricopeptide repeat protein n=1 Tax=Calothrix sp. NIES-3974 TaxID=2005462 RepID=UPI000B5FADB6|nr:tetratricopeptide repeat protein [Calothrix sp. NIES-3974]BAZ07361.1 peptidase, M50 family protein [Calothrix sp. NIES-3974]